MNHRRTIATTKGSTALQFLRPILLVIVLMVLSQPVMRVAHHAMNSQALPQWDMAKYGLAGLELADSGRRFNVPELVARVSALSSWPPGFPLLEAPVFLIFGAQYHVPRLLVCGLFLATLLAAVWAGHQLDERDGLPAGLLLAAALSGSPLYQAFAGLVLLEIPGALLFLLAAGSYFRALRLGTDASWRWTAIFSMALFFCKYNYGLMWLVPFGFSEVWRRVGLRRSMEGVLRQTLSVALRHKVWAGFLGFYFLLLGWIRLGGGIDFVAWGIRIKATSVGNLVYFLYLLGVLACLLRPQRSLELWRSWWDRLDAPRQILTRWLVVPIALWMVIPPHSKDFFGFLENRSSGIPIFHLESLLAYPRILVWDYAPWPALGAILLVAGILPCLKLGVLEIRRRALALAVICQGVAIWLHPYKLPRFAFTLVPLLWLLAAWLLARALRTALERSPAQRISAWGVLICMTWAALGIGSHFHAAEVERQWSVRTVSPEVRPLLDRIAALAVEEEGLLVLGTWNLLSPALVEWHFRLLYPGRLESMPTAVRPSSKARKQVVSGRAEVERVVVVEPLLGMPPELATMARSENAWLEPMLMTLEQGGAHVLTVDEDWLASGYRLRLFRRSG